MRYSHVPSSDLPPLRFCLLAAVNVHVMNWWSYLYIDLLLWDPPVGGSIPRCSPSVCQFVRPFVCLSCTAYNSKMDSGRKFKWMLIVSCLVVVKEKATPVARFAGRCRSDWCRRTSTCTGCIDTVTCSCNDILTAGVCRSS